MDAGSCKQSGVRQSVAGIVVGEKNRCIPLTPRQRLRCRFQAGFCAGRDNFRDNNGDKCVPRKSSRRIYLGFSPR